MTLHPTPSQPLSVLVLPMALSLGFACISWRLNSKKEHLCVDRHVRKTVMCAGSELCA